MADKIAFSRAAIEAVQPPKLGRKWVYDTKVRGLALMVTPSGARSFYVYRKINGKPKKIFIAPWPDLSVEQARKRAEEFNVQVAQGIDPTAERRESRQVATLGELFAWYLENHAKPHKRSWKQDEWQFNKYLADWAGKRLNEIKPSDLQSLHARMGKETGQIAANRLRALLHTLFEVGRKDLGFKGDNPAKAVKRFAEQPRERYLNAEELQRLHAAIAAEENELLADFFRLALFTAARRGNVQAARWDELDLEKGVWSIPHAKAKGKRVIHVPLTDEAIEVLQRRKAAAAGSEWVFPSHGKAGHLIEPKSAWERICARAGLEGVRLHDLRHTTASWMVAQGVPLYTVGKVLGHTNPQTTQRYAHLDFSALRSALGGVTQSMAPAPAPASQPNE